MRDNFKICAILNFIFIIFVVMGFNSSSFTLIPVLLLLSTGFYFLTLCNKSNSALKKEKPYIILMAIFQFWVNPITTIILLLTVDKINLLKDDNYRGSPDAEYKKLTPEARKLDIIFKLGIAMVVLSGIIFATTTSFAIPSIFKTIFLIIFSIIFLAMSSITSNKMDNKKASMYYYILGLIFIVASYFSLGSYGLIGDYLKIGALGEKIFLASVFLLISLILYISYKKYSNKSLVQSSYLCIFIAFILISSYFKVNAGIIYLIINSILLIANNINFSKNKHINNILKLITYIMLIITIFSDFGIAYVILNDFVLMLTLLTMNNKEKNEGTLNGVLTVLVVCTLSYFVNLELGIGVTTLILTLAILYFILGITKYLQKHDSFKITFVILTNYVMIIAFLAYLFDTCIIKSVYQIYVLVGLSLIILGTSLMSYIMPDNDKLSLEKNISSLKIMPFISTIGLCIINLSVVRVWMIIFLLFGVFAYFTKDNKCKKVNVIFMLISLIITTFINSFNPDMLISILLLTVSILLTLYVYYTKNSVFKKTLLPFFIYMLAVIYITFIDLDIFNISKIYLCLIVILLYILVIIITRKDAITNVITGYALTIPIYTLVEQFISDSEFNIMIISSLVLYITYLTCKKVIKKTHNKKAFATIVISLLLLKLVFTDSLLIALFVGVISLLSILLGLIKEDYRNLFVVGVTFTLMNIIYHLSSLWMQIPFWLYLLIIGLVLIGLVTYKEIRRK